MASVEELITVLQDAQAFSFRRRDAALQLGRSGEKGAFEPLVAALAVEDRYLRQAVVEALGMLGDRRAVEPLTALLQDPDSNLRRRAALALGELGDPAAVPALEEAREDPSWSVRSAAERALERLQPQPEKSVKTPVTAAGRRDPRFLMQRVVAGTDYQLAGQTPRFIVTVPLPTGRQQKVNVNFDLHDPEGLPLIALYTVCGPANPKLYEQALRMNLRLSHGALALASLEGRDCFVLVDSLLAPTADVAEIRQSLKTLAARGDELEKQLTGEDVR